jgi:hypothetical protein
MNGRLSPCQLIRGALGTSAYFTGQPEEFCHDYHADQADGVSVAAMLATDTADCGALSPQGRISSKGIGNTDAPSGDPWMVDTRPDMRLNAEERTTNPCAGTETPWVVNNHDSGGFSSTDRGLVPAENNSHDGRRSVPPDTDAARGGR